MFADFKAETLTVESPLHYVSCVVRRRKLREKRGKEPVMSSERRLNDTVVGGGMSAGWVTQGRCWPLLGLDLEADAGSRHWM